MARIPDPNPLPMQRRKRYFGWAGREAFDARDMFYTVSLAVLEALPPAVDLRGKFKTPPFDQGSIGSCGPQSAAADLLFAQEQSPHIPDVMPSRLQIYYHTRVLMGTVNQDSGVWNRDLCKALNQYGWADERMWPYDVRKFRTRPPQNVIADAATRKVLRYERIAQTLDIMRGAIAQNDPFIFGFNWYQSWEVGETAATGDLTITVPGDRVLGGHDVVICGYNDATQRFIFRNSWSEEWGRGGYGTIPYAQAINPEKASDFWTLHWDEAAPPEPLPPEPAPPEPLPPGPQPPGPGPAPGTNLLVEIDGQRMTANRVTVQVNTPTPEPVPPVPPEPTPPTMHDATAGDRSV